jgi:hypothetical protein
VGLILVRAHELRVREKDLDQARELVEAPEP